jgi:hypothetical protein
MSGEHVETTSWLIVTSGKSVIWPLEAPENQGFGKLQKFPRGKRPRHFWFLEMAYVTRQDTAKYAGEKIIDFLLL